MLLTINKFKHAVLKSEYIRKLSQVLDIEEIALLEEVHKIKPDRPYLNSQSPEPKKININPTEKLLIKLMLEENEFIRRIKEALEPTDFQDEKACRIISTIFELVEQGKNIGPSSLINYFADEEISKVLCESTLSPEINEQDREKIVTECIQRIKNTKLSSRRQRLQEEIKVAENLGDEDKINRLKEEFNCLIKKR
ncbi:MAG: hypothetical protein A3K83_06580 [Omnitrophica WOR_2 bacterium RBG_13_44_8b]|nr:MAG: hypothetical protein A3K83_06580 [Omnitrophica WOR_2 bacterium RBG_13_44_8b]